MKLFVSVLEYSANIHLRHLLMELLKYQNIEICGIFDEKILDSTQKDFDNVSCDFNANSDAYVRSDLSNRANSISGKSICNIEKVAVMGFIDVFKRIRFFINLNRECLNLALNADKILLMDSSSFNIPLAKRIKKRNPNKKIIYYILPQVWAWKPWRAKALEANCDKLAAILPFEVESYTKKAEFAGHPLLDEIIYFKNAKHSDFINNTNGKNNVCDKSNKTSDSTQKEHIFSFMPGSRKAEIERIFPVFIEVKNHLKAHNANAIFHLIIPQKFKGRNLEDIYKNLNDFIISFDAHKSLFHSKFAFICSGTATLECALIGTPFVLGYKCRAIEAFIARQFLRIKFIGLANLLYEKIKPNEIFHTELLQNDLNVKNLINAFESANESDFLAKSLLLRKYLKNGSAKVVAKWLYDL